MARHNLSAVVRYLQQLAGSAGASGASDAELVERYVRHHDEAAFELLVWRHGALVFNVCRRILPCEQDAEDAFQATFLAFVRKAGSISRRGSVAAWLYKVAYRAALEARERTRKTAAMEKSGSETLAVQPADDPLWSDVRPILDEELNRLPERLRRPIVLCYLEGKSNAEAARELGCRLGTIYSCLSRGRELLRQRLQRRGVALPVAALTATLTARMVEAAPAISLVRAAARAAFAFADPSAAAAVSPRVATLAEGVLRTMFVTKLKIAVVLVLMLGAAAGGVLTQARTADPPAEAKAEDPPPKPAGGDKKDAKPITVKVVKPKKGGQPQSFTWESVTQPAQRQQLFPLVAGTIKDVAVDVGDPVKKGQELIRLDAALVLNEVEQARAALDIAQARMEEAKVKADNAKQLAEKNVINLSEVNIIRAALKAAEANVRLAQAALAKARIQESFTHLTAEFDGVVAERNCDPGNLVQSGTGGTGKPLLTLVRVDRLRARVELSPQFARIAERGDPAQLSVEGVNVKSVNQFNGTVWFDLQGDPKDFIAGKIARISPIVDGVNSSRSAVIKVPNPNNRLVPGARVGVQIVFNKTRKPGATLVPSQCLLESGDKTYLFIVREGKAQRTPITVTSIKDDGIIEITGIQATDLIAASNQGELRSGTPVKTELIKDWQSLIRR
jgi:RND family efflux transporter MFP subunit